MTVSYTHLDVYKRQEWEDVDIFVDGEKIEMAGRALDEVVPPNRIESISVEKERNEAGSCLLYTSVYANVCNFAKILGKKPL